MRHVLFICNEFMQPELVALLQQKVGPHLR